MKTNDNYVLVYDRNCPFCNWYTKAFIQSGFLNENGRIPYDTIQDNPDYHFDRITARNKIALLNLQTGSVEYGINSLLTVLGNRIPIISRIGHLAPIHWLLEQLYSLISYNRKIIAPENCNGTCACNPNKSWGWRIAFAILCTLITFGSINLYFGNNHTPFFTNTFTEMLLFLLQIPFQWMCFRLLKQHDFYTYFGHLVFISCLSVVALPVCYLGIEILDNSGLTISFLPSFCYLPCAFLLMYFHSKRVKLLGLSPYLNLSFVFFRILFYSFTIQLVEL